jgi:ElaB/YqjD/DUF883 family membrane-anchored ribosome-binding protein
MDVQHNKYVTPKQQMAEGPASAGVTAQSILEGSAEVYGQAEQAVGDVYDKTARAVSETYEQAKSYSSENPGKTILIALGIGVGLGFLLGASSRHSRAGRFAKPVVNALSDIALEIFR